METAPQPPSSINAVSTVRSGLVMILIGINALWVGHTNQSLPLLVASLIVAVLGLTVGTAMLMYSTKYWLQYIHDYVDYRLAQQSTQPPSTT